jgi:hypothetical protein
MRFFLTVLVFIGFIRMNGQDASVFPWSKDRKLVWDDYRKIESNQESLNILIGAKTYTIIEYDEMQNGALTPPIAIFNGVKSWTSVNDTIILAHEQLHFDINELFMRKIRKEFVKLYYDKENNTQKFQLVIDKYLNELEIVQAVYDRESYEFMKRKNDTVWLERNNFIKILERWKNRIDIELANLKEFELD